MVWNIVFAYIDKEIASLGKGSVTSSLVISCIVIKKVKAGICSTRYGQFPNQQQQVMRGPREGCTHAATSAYVSMASIPFLFFSAIGMISLLAAIKSCTFANRSSRKVRR